MAIIYTLMILLMMSVSSVHECVIAMQRSDLSLLLQSFVILSIRSWSLSTSLILRQPGRTNNINALFCRCRQLVCATN